MSIYKAQMRSLPPASRRTDPINSHIAERAINQSGSRQRGIDTAVQLVNRYPNHTSGELARYGVMTERQLSRRLGEAANLRMIDRGPSRRCESTGHKACTWHPRPEGALL